MQSQLYHLNNFFACFLEVQEIKHHPTFNKEAPPRWKVRISYAEVLHQKLYKKKSLYGLYFSSMAKIFGVRYVFSSTEAQQYLQIKQDGVTP